jgi:hypothetical protein
MATVMDAEEVVPPSPSTSRRKSSSTRSSLWRSLPGREALQSLERTLHLGVRMHHHHHYHHFWLR